MNANHPSYKRMVKGAARYAAADRSDPFAFARAIAHIHSGVASLGHDDGGPAYYNAEETAAERTVVLDGRAITYPVTEYKNIQRP